MSEELVTRIGRLRIEHELDTPEPGAPAREQLDVVDGAIRVATNLVGKSDVERRAAFRELKPGVTVTAQGAEKTRSTRAEKVTKAIAAFKDWSQDQRDEYIASEQYEALSDKQQELVSAAFAQLEDRTDEGTSDTGDEGEWNLQALETDAPYVLTVDEAEGEAEEEGQGFAPLPWEERRDIHGNIYTAGDDV